MTLSLSYTLLSAGSTCIAGFLGHVTLCQAMLVKPKLSQIKYGLSLGVYNVPH